MSRLKHVLASLLATVALQTVVADDMIQWWPRVSPAAMPNNLEQLAALEFSPDLEFAEEVTLTITLPDGVTYKGYPTAWLNPTKPSVYAIPYPSLSAYPESYTQEGNTLTMKFPKGSFVHTPQTWLPMVLDVDDAQEGTHKVTLTLEDKTKTYTEDIELKIWPELSGEQSKKPLIAWNFQGLDEEFLPIYMNGLVQAGVNRFYEMREETPDRKSVVDLQDDFNTIHGTAFFGERIGPYFKANGLPAEVADRSDIVYDNAWLIDNPEVGEIFMRDYIKFLMDGKDFQVVIYDAERGAFKSNGTRIVGDLTPYSLAKFGQEFNIPAEDLTKEIITEKYQKEWIAYNCQQSADLAAMANRAVKKYFPEMTFEVYSGYEYDNAPYVDHTRKTYAIDWKSIKETGLDAGGAGYFGAQPEIRNTVAALDGVAPMLPAEMYLEAFQTAGVHNRIQVEPFAFRLIQTYLWTGANGMQLWYGCNLYGGGLIAVDIYTKFANLTSDLLDGATEIDIKDIATVSPAAVASNIYAYQKDGQTIIIILNPTDKPSQARLNLSITGEEIVDVVEDTTTTFKKFANYRLAGYSYKIIVINQ